ncbi:MAG TPA: ribonuclease III [Candidatus Atribacteria bacterium]|nr:ribonuclease III [Candidatus Atribacteria bacterium]
MPFNEAELIELERRIGYHFENRSLLKTALLHKSALEGKEGHCNDKLEWLGDAVVGLYIADYLFSQYEKPRSWLSAMKAKWASEESLAQVARNIHLERFILLGKGEEKGRGREKSSIISSALEALVGAVYLDSKSFDMTKKVLDTIFSSEGGLELVFLSVNYKSLLQTWSLKEHETLPFYQVMEESLDRKNYRIAVLINGKELAIGEGTNKKKAEQEAARKAWEKIIEEKYDHRDNPCF